MKTFNIKYEIHLKDGNVIKDKEINVKKCEFGVEAQYKLENYLKKKYPNFKKMVVISGVGVRGYYKKLGYKLQDSYMVKKIVQLR